MSPGKGSTGPAPSRPVESIATTVRRLASVQKSSAGAPAYSRWVNRPLGRVLAAASYRVGLTPNGVTISSAAWSFAAIAVLALAPARWWVGVFVALALIIGYAFDSADGQLARLRGGGSAAGEWLDHMVDATKISALHLAVLISLFRFFDLSSAGWYLVPMAFVVIGNSTFFGFILTDQLRRQHGRPSERGYPSRIRSLLAIPTDYGLLCLSFLLLGGHTLFLTVYCFLAAANALFCAKWIKWFRDMTRLKGPAT
jgi:phosphatidylglycerophosphate synthase